MSNVEKARARAETITVVAAVIETALLPLMGTVKEVSSSARLTLKVLICTES
jgi:hypothetical protein